MKLASASATRVTYAQLKSSCLCLALALAAYLATVPVWILIVVCAAGAIRLSLAARGYAPRAVPFGSASPPPRSCSCSSNCVPSTDSRPEVRS